MTEIVRTPFITTIRTLFSKTMGADCHFHLSPCGQCGGPSFQQPCVLCGYYPMGRFAKKPAHPTITCEAFERSVFRSGFGNAAGNIATWYGKEYARRSACPSFSAKLMLFVEAAQTLADLPSAAEVYDLVAIQEHQLL